MGLVVLSVVTLLVLVNALYVAAEFGAVSVRRSRIEELAAGGNRLAGLLVPVLRDPAALDRYVATCQIGITLSSLVLGAYGQATLAVALAPLLSDLGRLQPLVAESTAAVVVLIALTVFQVVFGELVPKSLALRTPHDDGALHRAADAVVDLGLPVVHRGAERERRLPAPAPRHGGRRPSARALPGGTRAADCREP